MLLPSTFAMNRIIQQLVDRLLVDKLANSRLMRKFAEKTVETQKTVQDKAVEGATSASRMVKDKAESSGNVGAKVGDFFRAFKEEIKADMERNAKR